MAITVIRELDENPSDGFSQGEMLSVKAVHAAPDDHDGRQTPTADQITYTADFARPGRWWIVGADSKPPRESSRYERARGASLAIQNAIRAARPAPAAARDDAPAAAASDAPHAVDHPGRDAALTPAQRTAAVHAHQQAAMPQEHLEGRTTAPATWMRTPENLERLAAFTREAAARSRAIADREQNASATDQGSWHQQPGPEQGHGLRPSQRP